MTIKVAILQSNYIPWKGYFDLIDQVDYFVIYDTVQYTKNDWRNRNKIKTNSGLQWLTIPVKVEGLSQPINETHVADNRWVKKHLNSILQSYSKAAYLQEYKNELIELYEQAKKLTLISEINMLFIKWINDKLGITTEIRCAEDFKPFSEDKVQRLVDICKILEADVYVSGPAAKSYLDECLFNDEGIRVEWISYKGFPEYKQLHSGFEHSSSILDVILNEGDNAKRVVLRRYFDEV